MITNNERLTSQKQVIFEYLISNYNHPNSKEIYEAVKKTLPRISRATVHRILNQLVKKKLIKRLYFTNTYYEAKTTCHPHFICQKCGQIYDVDIKLCPIISGKKIPNVGKVDSHIVNLFGLCQKCIKKGVR
jgi:Fur family peroxide stress response transcriptional regulator